MRPRFWKHFGKVLGGVWEANIVDFRIFFSFFSMQNLECNLEGQKIKKKTKRQQITASWGEVGGHLEAPGKENRMGSRSTIVSWSSTLRTPSVGGGLKTPGGGSPPPTHPWQFGHLVIEFLFGRFLAVLGVRGSI